MALPGDIRHFERPIRKTLRDWLVRFAIAGRRVGAAYAWSASKLEPIGDWFANSWLARRMSASLLRRIIISNLIGFALLLFGWAVLSQQNVWLIDTKRDALETQSRIIAAAVASATPKPQKDARDYDPDRLATEAPGRIAFDDQAVFRDLDLSLRPEQVAPTLAQVVKGTNTRARIYALDGTPIVDSKDFDLRGGLSGLPDPKTGQVIKPKNIWTRALSWRVRSPLTVYQDIEGISGLSFREVSNALKLGTSEAMLLMTEDGEQVVGFVSPIVRLGKTQGALLLSTKPGEIDDLLFAERLRILTLAILAFVATLAASILLARTVAGPMRRLSESAERVSLDINASRDLPSFAGREDEIGQMSRSFSKMTDALRRRIEASEKFAADVAHELKNPLTAARSTAESLTYAKTDEQRDELVAAISSELARLNRLITDVSNASRLDAELARQETKPIEILELASSVVDTFRDIMSGDSRNLTITLDSKLGSQPSTVLAHEGRMGQVLTNLIDNALSFSNNGGVVRVELSASTDELQIAIEDNGPGISPENIDAIFTRFYTYRPTEFSSRGANSGLGLSISREIISAHGGVIWAENRKSGGARFVVRLPLVRRTAPGSVAKPGQPGRRGRA
ncbi:MAG: stimulus-sensing domain-containing protein [Pseudomonadota bacterium]